MGARLVSARWWGVPYVPRPQYRAPSLPPWEGPFAKYMNPPVEWVALPPQPDRFAEMLVAMSEQQREWIAGLFKMVAATKLPPMREWLTGAEQTQAKAWASCKPQPFTPRVLIHRACGKGAIRLVLPIAMGDVCKARYFEHLDGRPAADGEGMLCDSCGARFDCNNHSLELFGSGSLPSPLGDLQGPEKQQEEPCPK